MTKFITNWLVGGDYSSPSMSEDALEKALDVKETTNKVRMFINKMKDSNLMKKEGFLTVMVYAGDEPLAIIQGTSNRWYFKYKEAERVLLLKVHVEKFQQDYDDFQDHLVLEDEDWKNLSIYVTAVKIVSDASDVLEGRDYQTG